MYQSFDVCSSDFCIVCDWKYCNVKPFWPQNERNINAHRMFLINAFWNSSKWCRLRYYVSHDCRTYTLNTLAHGFFCTQWQKSTTIVKTMRFFIFLSTLISFRCLSFSHFASVFVNFLDVSISLMVSWLKSIIGMWLINFMRLMYAH